MEELQAVSELESVRILGMDMARSHDIKKWLMERLKILEARVVE